MNGHEFKEPCSCEELELQLVRLKSILGARTTLGTRLYTSVSM